MIRSLPDVGGEEVGKRVSKREVRKTWSGGEQEEVEGEQEKVEGEQEKVGGEQEKVEGEQEKVEAEQNVKHTQCVV